MLRMMSSPRARRRRLSAPDRGSTRQELRVLTGVTGGHGLTEARGLPSAAGGASVGAAGPPTTSAARAKGRSPRIRQCTLATTTRVRVHDSTQAAHRHADLPQDPGGALLLRGQDRLHSAVARQGGALLPVAPAALRQEPVPRHLQGAVRGQRAAVRGARHPRPVGLVGAASRAAPQLRQRQLQGTGLPAHQPDGPARRPGGTARRRVPLRHGRGALRTSGPDVERAGRATGRRPGRRVRQADSGRAGRAGCRPRQPRFPPRPLRGRQGL